MNLLRRILGYPPQKRSCTRRNRREAYQSPAAIVETLETRWLLATFAVVNTEDSGPGSLRQAILDANTAASNDIIAFDIPTSDPNFVTPAGLDCDSTNNGIPDAPACWWRISLSSSLPAITGNGTEIRGLTQPTNANPGVVGTVIAVGVDGTTLPQKTRPEVAIKGNNFDAIIIDGNATGIVVEGLAIYDATNGVVVTSGTTSHPVATLRNLLVGTLPDGSDPGIAERNLNSGVVVNNLAQVTVTTSYVGLNGQSGINALQNGSVLHAIFNEVFGNGWNSDDHDGIDVNGIDSDVQFNYVHHNTNHDAVLGVPAPDTNSGNGIELGTQPAGTGHILVENNTVEGNVSAGIAIQNGSSGDTIRKNVVTGNAVGVSVVNENSVQTNNNAITQNRMFDNAGLGIDLHAPGAVGPYDGVTRNDASDADAGPNNLTNFPVIVQAHILDANLVVSGFAEPGTVIEFFIAAPDSSGFGEGRTLLATATEGSAKDTDSGTGSYGPTVNGVTVSNGTISANRFSFTLTASDVTTAVTEGAILTATGTVLSNTSEFSPNVTVALETNSISGFVFEDSDNDGIRDGGENGIQGVVITLTGVDDHAQEVERTIATDTDGHYLLDGLRPGVYSVRETQPAGFADGKDSVGSLAGTKLNDAFIAIQVATGDNGVNYNFGELATFPSSSIRSTFLIIPDTEQRIQLQLLSAPGFNPADINPTTVRFGNAPFVRFRLGGDINGDGQGDLLLFFKAKATGLQRGDRKVSVVGQFNDGRSFGIDLDVQTILSSDVRIVRHGRRFRVRTP
jgi:hypothetical protein